MPRHAILLPVAILLLLCAILACGCTATPAVPAGEMKKFGSVDEIRQYIRENTEKAQEYGYGATDGMVRVAEAAVAAPSAGAQNAMKSASDLGGMTGAAGYSTTNVQVAGVDEPDFLKNDGKYLYLISGGSLVIVNAYPAQGASIVSETPLEGSVRELFVTGDRLVLFSTGSADIPVREGGGTGVTMEKVAMVPPYYYWYTPVTHATVYDIGDRRNPEIVSDYTVDGDYVDARMIKGIVYLLTRENIYTYDDIVVPAVREGGRLIATPDVYYFDNPEGSYIFSTVTSLDARTGQEKDAKTFLIGSGTILYVSTDAMYVSYQRWHPVARAYDGPQIAIAAPESGVASDSSPSAPLLYEDFNRLSESEKQAVIADMKSGERESIRKKEYDQTTTVIHKIAIGNGNIAYIARGEVSGYLKNQFAMDEYDGNLRVASTSDVWTRRGQYEYNNVFVLDGSMKMIGSLTHIAEQEKIYSTRFIGDRLYMVTFKRIDPFFVIDLSNPSHPKILGKLKIPGYSDYLHPYDSNHIIGVGKETATNDWGGVSTRGVKVALFDVSDVEHPKQVGKVEIGEAGTDSAALYDHKAFLFDKGKNLLVLPIRQVTLVPSGERPGAYDGGQRIWYGAYVFGVSPDAGFILRGTVTHGTSSTGYYWYGNSADEVKRSLYIDDTLYTVSTGQIIASDLNNVNTTIRTIDLKGGPDYPDVPAILK